MLFSPAPSRRRRAFSLVETTIAVVLVGGLYIAALNTVGASQVTQASFADRQAGMTLAQELLDEILAKPYDDPQDGNATFGIETDESAPRNTFDDVDDFHDWSANPPQDPEGNTRLGIGRYTRTAVVEWVELANPKNTQNTDTGIKRITVTVLVGNKEVATLTGLRAASWPDPQDLAEPNS